MFLLCRCLGDETAVLLLYTLVHGNSDFLEYVLVRTDLDTLVWKINSMLCAFSFFQTFKFGLAGKRMSLLEETVE